MISNVGRKTFLQTTRFVQLISFSVLALLLSHIILPTQLFAITSYRGIPWGSPFPTIEARFPGVSFEGENDFKMVTFSLESTEQNVTGIVFKLFANKLTAIDMKYSVPLDSFMNEKYLQFFLGDLGKRVKIENKKIPTARGMTDTVMWDYGDILVFFQSYPADTVSEKTPPENIIKFVYKPSFNEMKRYIRNNPDGDGGPEDDFDAVSF